MSTPSRENPLDHVGVVMFENRSFDNLLGRLYQAGEVASYEGVIGKELTTRSRHGPSTTRTARSCPKGS
jgi:phospholipase C